MKNLRIYEEKYNLNFKYDLSFLTPSRCLTATKQLGKQLPIKLLLASARGFLTGEQGHGGSNDHDGWRARGTAHGMHQGVSAPAPD